MPGRCGGGRNIWSARELAGRKLIATRRSRFPAERESWRRLTSMTLELEPFMDDQERRAGLKRLVDWIEETVLNRRGAGTRRTETINGQRSVVSALVNGETADAAGAIDPSPYLLPQGEGEQQMRVRWQWSCD